MRPALRVVAICAAAISVTAQPQSDRLPHGTWRIAEAPSELRGDIARADLTVVSIQDAVLRELRDTLAEGGPPAAARSCHVDVAWMIRRIEQQNGVAAGRTSDRLRNPANAPPKWAASLVEANAGRRARDVAGFAVDLGSSVGVLRPIVQQAMCKSCHGPAKNIDPAVKAELEKRYPADRATGFRPGDLRGWFWVEVQKHPR